MNALPSNALHLYIYGASKGSSRCVNLRAFSFSFLLFSFFILCFRAFVTYTKNKTTRKMQEKRSIRFNIPFHYVSSPPSYSSLFIEGLPSERLEVGITETSLVDFFPALPALPALQPLFECNSFFDV